MFGFIENDGYIAVFATGTTAANPQLMFFENYGRVAGNFLNMSQATISFQMVNIPLSISFKTPVVFWSNPNTSAKSYSVSLGLYSMNGSTLSLANSASKSTGFTGGDASGKFYLSLATSATQNIAPGVWYFAVGLQSSSNSLGLYANSSYNAAGAIPGQFLAGRMTASSSVMPASVATSDLDITGADAHRQAYVILTA